MSSTVERLRRWHQGDQQALAEWVAADGAWITAHVQRRLGPLLRARVDTQDVLSCQAWSAHSGTCLGAIALSDTIDFTIL